MTIYEIVGIIGILIAAFCIGGAAYFSVHPPEDKEIKEHTS